MARSFFYSDDWVHLEFSRAIPPWQVWRYFSPRVIWFYRPLQTLQFGWLYHLVGLRPFAYNLSLLLMHFGVCLLIYRLAAALTTQRVALVVTTLFGSQWVYASMMTWRSNFNTLHWALTTLGMAVLFVHYLQTGERRALAGTYLLLVVSFFVKEATMNAPLLLGALWWWQRRQQVAATGWRATLREGFRLLAPPALLVLLYVVLHRLGVHDIYDGYIKPGYRYVGLRGAIDQTLFSLNYLILSFVHEPLALLGMASLQHGLTFLAGHGYLLAIALGIVIWRCRDAQVTFGLLWALASMLPMVAMTGFRADRFFYLPTVGTSFVLARGVQLLWSRLRPIRAARVVTALAGGFLILANLSVVVRTGLNDQENARHQAAVFRAVRTLRGRLAPGSLVVLRNLNEPTGFGTAEMVRIALDDATAMGVRDGQNMPDSWTRRLERIPSAYVVECDTAPPRVWCLRSPQGGVATVDTPHRLVKR